MSFRALILLVIFLCIVFYPSFKEGWSLLDMEFYKKRKGLCNTYQCPSGSYVKNPKTECTTCTDEICCAKNQTCNNVKCPPNTYNTFNQTSCSGGKCTVAECCTVAPQKKCSELFPCPFKTILRPEPEKIKCVGEYCSVDECCGPMRMPRCTDFTCPAAYAPINAKIVCDTDPCTISQCCTPYTSCIDVKCPNGTFKKHGNIVCKNCSEKDCCAPATCASIQCSKGFYKKSNTDVCTNGVCTFDQCCRETPAPPLPPPPLPQQTTTRNYYSGNYDFQVNI